MGAVAKIKDKLKSPTSNPRGMMEVEDLNKLVVEMDEIKSNCEEERSNYDRQIKIWNAWALGDKRRMDVDRYGLLPTVLPGQTPKKEAWQSVKHSPLVTQLLRTLMASLNASKMEHKVVPKCDQKTLQKAIKTLYSGFELPEYSVDEVALMLNVFFQRTRDKVGWTDKFRDCWMDLGVVDHVGMRVIVENLTDWPNKIVNIQKLNTQEYYHTTGRGLRDSTKIVVGYYLEPEELKAMYPEYSDEIDAMAPSRQAGDGDSNADVASSAGRNWSTKPQIYYGDSEVSYSKTSVLSREFWQFDPSISRYSKESDEEDIDKEEAYLAEYIKNPLENPIDQIPATLLFEDRQYHRIHVERHTAIIEEWRKIALDEVKSGAREQAISMLTAHIETHQEAARKTDEEDEGYYEKYEKGWRQTIIVGDGGNQIAVYDGKSLYVDLGINRQPFKVFNMMNWSMVTYGPSFVDLLVDLNAIKDGALNFTLDNVKWSGSNKLEIEEGDKEAIESGDVDNNPGMPNVWPEGALSENRTRWTQGMPPNPAGPMLVSMMNAEAGQASGIFGSVRGQAEKGVRSGEQVEQLVERSLTQMTDVFNVIEVAYKELCYDFMKASLSVPPPEDILKPIEGDKNLNIDYKLLQSLEYTLEIEIKQDSLNVRQEQLKTIQILMQNFGQALAQLPSGLKFILDLLDPILQQDAPPEMKETVEQIKQEIMAMQGQQAQPGQPGAQNQQLPPGATGRP